MRLACVLWLALSFGIARADGAWSEFGVGLPLRPAQDVSEAWCEIGVTVQGAIATVEQREQLTNAGPQALASVSEVTLPEGAQLVGFELRHGGKAQAGIAVNAGFNSERVTSESVLGADPGIVTALAPDNGKPRFRVIVQPIDRDQDATITLRWTRATDIRGGALHLELPGREGKACKGTIQAKPGPGATIARVRVGGVESSSHSFTLGKQDLALDIDLAFKRSEPLVWTQSEPLGDGLVAQAVTILAPPGRATGAKRVLFVIDGSRSMELVGRHRVKQVVHALAGMLAKGTEVEAIVYDRTASRVLGAWQAIDAKTLATIETAIDQHAAGNGSDTAIAFALARQAIADLRGETQLVLVTDGVMGEQSDAALAQALGPSQVTLHAIVLSRGRMRIPDADPLHIAINHSGGSYRELDVEQLDSAITSLDDWLQPSFLELTLMNINLILAGGWQAPEELRAGAGAVIKMIVERPSKPTLVGHTTKPFKIAAVALPAAPIAELVLAQGLADPANQARLGLVHLRHPVVDADHPFVVLATQGKIAKSRHEVTASGGPYTRMIAVDDPKFPADAVAAAAAQAAAATGGSAIDRTALELMFRTQLQPAAFACYQKALVREPKLAGTAQFKIEIGRGETTRAQVSGFADPVFQACLLDAAYRVTPSLPNPDYNTDDRTIANYPLTFSVREEKPFVIAGDADSSSPLDINAIKGGVPIRVQAIERDTPLGNLRPSEKMKGN